MLKDLIQSNSSVCKAIISVSAESNAAIVSDSKVISPIALISSEIQGKY